jgi:hypothetical protein
MIQTNKEDRKHTKKDRIEYSQERERERESIIHMIQTNKEDRKHTKKDRIEYSQERERDNHAN